MPHKLHWTPASDATLGQLRLQGWSWDAIAEVMQMSRNAAIERGRRIGARLPPRVRMAKIAVEDPNRDPLPAGHPVSWAVLVAGTLLAGQDYPPPAPLGRLGRMLPTVSGTGLR